jgi:hypothetical protein
VQLPSKMLSRLYVLLIFDIFGRNLGYFVAFLL